MAPRRKASIASSKPLDYNPRDLCHPEEIEAVEAECEEDDKTVEKQDVENDDSEFSPSQDSSQETGLTSSQSTIYYVLSQSNDSNDSEDTESQWTYSQSSQSYYGGDDARDDSADYRPPRISQLDELLTEGNSPVQNEEHDNDKESWSFNSSSPRDIQESRYRRKLMKKSKKIKSCF